MIILLLTLRTLISLPSYDTPRVSTVHVRAAGTACGHSVQLGHYLKEMYKYYIKIILDQPCHLDIFHILLGDGIGCGNPG